MGTPCCNFTGLLNLVALDTDTEMGRTEKRFYHFDILRRHYESTIKC